MTIENRMKRWRNVICPDSEPDDEIRAIFDYEDELDEKPAAAEHIRALISRIDPLSHYKAFENVDFIIEAIGEMDYPGMPAVDVLWRHGDIDDERRAHAKCYVHAIDAWLDGKRSDEAGATHPGCVEHVEKVYTSLGEADGVKRWLAMTLRKTLKERSYTPWDVIDEYDDADFIRAVYLSILGRPPSPDDLKFRVEELESGKTREEFLQEILSAPEHEWGHLARLAGQLQRMEG